MKTVHVFDEHLVRTTLTQVPDGDGVLFMGKPNKGIKELQKDNQRLLEEIQDLKSENHRIQKEASKKATLHLWINIVVAIACFLLGLYLA